MAMLKGLIIGSPQIDNIMSGKKTWEMRTTGTKQRGPIALIRKGSGQIVGIAEIAGSLGPLSRDELVANENKHLIPPTRLDDPKVKNYRHAWVLVNSRLLATPVGYRHPNGAVIWVALDSQTSEAALSK